LYNNSPALFNLVNRVTCLRMILMDWMQETMADPTTKLPAPAPDKCCNVCNPSLMPIIPFPWETASNLRKPHSGTAFAAFYDRLVLWCDKIVSIQHPTMRFTVSQLLAEKNELIKLSKEYQVINSAIELEEFVDSAWLKANFESLVLAFFGIKSYIGTNWPKRSRLVSVAIAQAPMSQERSASPTDEYHRSRERRYSEESQCTPATQYPSHQERSASFQRERDDYITKLRDTIRQAKESIAICSPCPTPREVPAAVDSSFMFMAEPTTFTADAAHSSLATSVFEDSENEASVEENASREAKRSASMYGGPETKRVALGALDLNARRSPRSNQMKNARFDSRDWDL
jgi:hypothetical protein